jgi:diguanylate cyclase (GGDEF)-like protein
LNIDRSATATAKILIVDDTPDNLDLLSSVLKKRGYEIRCAISGSIALQIAQSKWADLILLDIQMPEMDGYEVCQQLKANSQTENIPVIFISALDDIGDKKKAFALGGVDYITKPFQIKEVVVRVANQIAISSAKAQILELNAQLEAKVQKRTAQLEVINQKLKAEIEQKQQVQDRLLRMALQDSITGLANRNAFVSRIQQALKLAAKQPNYFFAVILLECDRFKTIKRSIGHIESNQLFMAIGNRLGALLPKSSLLSRFEGDEFAIFIDEVTEISNVTELVEQIQQKLIAPFQLQRRKISINTNVGITIGNQDYQDSDRLLNDADIAMQKAKTIGNNQYQVFQPDMYIQLHFDVEYAQRELEIKQALQNQEFLIYYLPIVALNTGNTVELEALVRWQHPEKGLIAPKDFVPIAEETGLIISIGDVVLKQACRQISLWQQRSSLQKNLRISINLSAKQLFEPNLLPKIDLILKKTQLYGRNLKLEISEAAILENEPAALDILPKLKKRQIILSLDNFGTGYSSLTYLHRFPFDNLKIDRSLVNNIQETIPLPAENASKIVLIEQILNLAHQMNMTVTAEGIETQYQFDFLKKMGCDYGEGHLISELLDTDAVENYLVWSINEKLS